MGEREKNEISRLYDLIEDLDTAMMTTRRADGKLVSRPMANQDWASGADLWFVTEKDSDKVREIQADPNINLAYYKDRTREWVSVTGTARIVEDRSKIRVLYKPDWKAWFSEDGLPDDKRAGTPEDPRMVLIGVRAELATWMTVNKPQPLVLLDLVKGMVTGKEPNIGDVHSVDLGSTGGAPPRKGPPERSS
jgi:general stress protein 26